MGKSKKRIFNKNKIADNISMTRENAISAVLLDIKNNMLDAETKKIISLFGISIEELAESGAAYEELMALKKFYKLL